MNAESLDGYLKDRFAEIRHQDAGQIPGFDDLLRPKPTRARRPGPTAWSAAAVAALVLIVAGVTIFRGPSMPDESELQQWAALSGWAPSTDALLEIAETPWGYPRKTETDAWIRTGSSSTDETAPSGAKETL